MIDLTQEKVFTLREIAEQLPVSYKTVHVWSKKGHRGVVLETLKLGGKVVTSMEAVQRFTEQLKYLDEQTPPAVDRNARDVTRRLREEHGL